MINFINKKTENNQPIDLRIIAFRDYFIKKGFNIEDESLKNDSKYIFYSMPPFRNLGIFFKKKGRVILDIRDGWSIAQATGYGGNVRKKPLKSFITKMIERFIIRRSFITITCTPGLVKHLEKVSGKKIILIPNGLSDNRIELIHKLKISNTAQIKNSNELIFICAGKFSEYGISKVKKLLSTIATRYKDKKPVIQLIGSDQECNAWVVEYFKDQTNGKGRVEILPRMKEQELFKKMLNADYGLTIIRDPLYDLGTKVYDYIALGLPIVNYFDEPNNFTDYFNACLDLPFSNNNKVPEIRRSVLIENGLKNVKF